MFIHRDDNGSFFELGDELSPGLWLKSGSFRIILASMRLLVSVLKS